MIFISINSFSLVLVYVWHVAFPYLFKVEACSAAETMVRSVSRLGLVFFSKREYERSLQDDPLFANNWWSSLIRKGMRSFKFYPKLQESHLQKESAICCPPPYFPLDWKLVFSLLFWPCQKQSTECSRSSAGFLSDRQGSFQAPWWWIWRAKRPTLIISIIIIFKKERIPLQILWFIIIGNIVII